MTQRNQISRSGGNDDSDDNARNGDRKVRRAWRRGKVR
jgi:hypothetical protein